MSEWKTAKVRADYHISVASMFYSVPYEYINRQVEVKLSDTFIEVFFNHMRIASHQRLIKSATFIDSNACIENIEYHEDRRLDKDQILKLANGVYIQEYHNIILKGPTGSGKSFNFR